MIRHIVLAKFKADISEETIAKLYSGFHQLTVKLPKPRVLLEIVHKVRSNSNADICTALSLILMIGMVLTTMPRTMSTRPWTPTLLITRLVV